MKTLSLLLLTLLAVSQVATLGVRKALHHETVFGKGPEHEQRIKNEVKDMWGDGPTNYTRATLVDHFNGSNDATYNMRYIMDDTHYNNETGPILFYAGNEGGIWTFYNNSLFMAQTLAKEYGALVVFAEHRYYGESMPFGEDSFKKENLRFLTIEQVMLDYVDLLNQLKSEKPELEKRATILFGGSYGGMLASWMRMKYPQHFQGALASSAPILWF
jgi:lysosomal Pro-X carboxypeptidase